MRKLAIITGASSGIGLEFVKILSKENMDLLLIARSADRLEELKNSFANVEYIALDLSCDFDIEIIKKEIKDRELTMLINNAGYGDFGEFVNADIGYNLNMINLNIKALTKLSHFFLNEVKYNKNKAYLLNVASIASFMAGPLMSVYYATKSYVLSFTKAINYEYRENKNVIISCLCPGPTNTNFVKASNLENSKLFDKLKNMSAEEVANIGYKSLLKEKTIIIPSLYNKLAIYMIKFAPDFLTNYFTYQLMKRK